MDFDYLEQLTEMEEEGVLHYVQLKKIEGDESAFLAKFNNLETLLDQEDIIKKFGAGTYVLSAVYWEVVDGEKKRRTKTFKLGKLGIEREEQEAGMDAETKEILSALAQGVAQNNKVLEALVQQQAQPKQSQGSTNDLILGKLIDKALNADKTNMEMFFRGMNTAIDMTPEPEEKEPFDLSSLGSLFNGSAQTAQEAAGPSALEAMQ